MLIFKPFLRWAGGKSKIVKMLGEFVPPKESFNRYIEPFVGGGALFFHIAPRKAILSDLNEDLINCYKQVASHPIKIWNLLQVYCDLDNKEFYYSIRAQNKNALKPVEQAARFIYLNKAAFNGIYRVSRLGEFNVPYGPSTRGPAIPDSCVLRRASIILKRAKLLAQDYREVCNTAKRDDFIYLDPPYPPTNGTAYFTHYTSDRFSWEDQVEVVRVFKSLDRKGCLVMMSNSDRKRLRSMLHGYNIARLAVTRWLGSDGNRYKVHELVVTNYDNKDFMHRMRK